MQPGPFRLYSINVFSSPPAAYKCLPLRSALKVQATHIVKATRERGFPPFSGCNSPHETQGQTSFAMGCEGNKAPAAAVATKGGKECFRKFRNISLNPTAPPLVFYLSSPSKEEEETLKTFFPARRASTVG